MHQVHTEGCLGCISWCYHCGTQCELVWWSALMSLIQILQKNLAVETAAYLTTKHPDYAIIAACIAISNLHKERLVPFSKPSSMHSRPLVTSGRNIL